MLVVKRNRVDNAWHQIDVQLSRRRDLIPALTETVKHYARHERGVLEDAAEKRSMAEGEKDVSILSGLEDALSSSLTTMLGVAEEYPELRADEDFAKLQEELTRTETRIAGARKYYNATVMHYDNARQGFPGNVVARILTSGFPDKPYFEASMPRAREVPRAAYGETDQG
jgi:LemA protein